MQRVRTETPTAYSDLRRFCVRQLLATCVCLIVFGASGARESAWDRIFKTRLDLAVRAGLHRRVMIDSILAGNPDRGIETLAQVIASNLPPPGRTHLSDRQADALGAVADALLFLSHCGAVAVRIQPSAAFLEWLTSDDERLAGFLDLLAPQDNVSEILRILKKIFAAAPQSRDAFFRLALATAVVWDSPPGPPHGQTGGKLPGPRPGALDVFLWFSRLYGKGWAALDYRRLPTDALVFVVAVPVALSELDWALENVRGSASGWSRKFSDIRYDRARLARRRFVWPHGVYSLEAIRRYGGICVDQAWYAVLTARAHGIPAIMFSGQGRRGPHAWFAYMKNEKKWETDVGRYVYDRYATGHAVNPQTKEVLTDHDLDLLFDRSLYTSRYRRSARFRRLAAVCLGLKRQDLARAYAREAVDASPLSVPAWRTLEAALTAGRDTAADDILALLDEEARRFRKYPDVVAEVRARQAAILQKLGRKDQADSLLRRTSREVDRERDDLRRFIGLQQIEAALRNNDPVGARRKLEDLLRKYRNEGSKILPLVKYYVEMTAKTNQAEDALRFLKRYLPPLQRRADREMWWAGEKPFLELLIQACENAGDQRSAERYRRRLRR